MLNDMGIAVYEQAPDAATLLIQGNTTATSTEEEAEEAAEAAVPRWTRVRPHDRPGAHVHARNGHGRAADPRRRNRNRQAHRRRPAGHDAGHLASPTTIAEILDMAAKIRAGESQISEVVDGFVAEDEADDYVAEEDFDEFDEEDDDDGNGGSKALTKKLEELKIAALVKFDLISSGFDKMRKAFEKDGYKSTSYNKAQEIISSELMTIRFTVKTIESCATSCAARSMTCAATSASCARSWSTSAACRRTTSSRPSRPMR